MILRDFLNLYVLAALLGSAGLWTVAAASERERLERSSSANSLGETMASALTEGRPVLSGRADQKRDTGPEVHAIASTRGVSGGASLRVLAASIADEHALDLPIFLALIHDESTWRVRAVGKNGEHGLLQLKAGTAKWCGGLDRFDAEANLRCGARYLRAQFDTFGSWELAVVAFKAGPGSIPDNIPARSWAYAQRTLRKAEALR